MPNMISIGGVQVDQDDPCALYQALYATKLKLIAGDSVEELSIQSPVTRETMRVTAGNLKALEAELMRLSAACSRVSGQGRARFAKSAVFRR